jgi:hypothetical protein
MLVGDYNMTIPYTKWTTYVSKKYFFLSLLSLDLLIIPSAKLYALLISQSIIINVLHKLDLL